MLRTCHPFSIPIPDQQGGQFSSKPSLVCGARDYAQTNGECNPRPGAETAGKLQTAILGKSRSARLLVIIREGRSDRGGGPARGCTVCCAGSPPACSAAQR